jgi:hypothetical protein
VRNVLAAGGCEVIRAGERMEMIQPRLLGEAGAERMPAAVRPVLKLLRVNEFLELTRS